LGQRQLSVISGALAPNAYLLNNPVVLAQSNDGKVFVTPVTRSLTFQLSVPSGATYRLLLANNTLDGKYRAISRINWATSTGPVRWAHLSSGSVHVGTVHPRGTACNAGGTGSSPQGDNAQGNEDDDAIACDARDQTDSDGDQNHDNDIQGDDNTQDQDTQNQMAANCGCQLPQGEDDNAQGQEDNGDHLILGVPGGPDGGVCAPSTPPTTGGTSSGGSPTPDAGSEAGGTGSPCTVNSDCGTGLSCMSNVCGVQLT
jgi:hypothetical protein